MQKPKGTGLWRCGKKWYGQMSHPSLYSPQVGESLCGLLQEQCRPGCLTPTVMGVGGSFTCGGHGLGPLVPLEGRVTANQYKVVWLTPFILWWNTSILMGGVPAPIHRVAGRKIYRVWKWCESYAVALAVTRSQPSRTPMGDFEPTCSTALSTIILKIPNEGIHFRRMLFIPPVEFRDL